MRTIGSILYDALRLLVILLVGFTIGWKVRQRVDNRYYAAHPVVQGVCNPGDAYINGKTGQMFECVKPTPVGEATGTITHYGPTASTGIVVVENVSSPPKTHWVGDRLYCDVSGEEVASVIDWEGIAGQHGWTGTLHYGEDVEQRWFDTRAHAVAFSEREAKCP